MLRVMWLKGTGNQNSHFLVIDPSHKTSTSLSYGGAHTEPVCTSVLGC